VAIARGLFREPVPTFPLPFRRARRLLDASCWTPTWRIKPSIDEAVEVAVHVDAILLDSGNQSLAVKELGGTGRVHDWRLSARIREAAGVPLFLAGGLHAGNVHNAVRDVAPFGLDLCSGVRTDGALDERKLTQFFASLDRGESG
jgi:phosphoribosylanthranilate isomerase